MIKKINYLTVLLFTLVNLFGCKEGSKQVLEKEDNSEKKEDMDNEILELLVGTFTGSGSKGIYKLDFDLRSGTLGNKVLLVEKENPGFLYLSKDRSRVYSSNSGEPGSVSVFEFNEDRSRLNWVGDHSSLGNGACHIEIDDKGNLLAAANYGSGNIVAYPLDEKGNVVDSPQSFQHSGNGPHPNQKSPHAHCVKFDNSGEFLYAVDLGIDKIVSYEVIAGGTLGKSHVALKTDPGDGPRHMIFHPHKDIAFIVNELSSSVISASVDPEGGSLKRIDKQNTLPPDFEGGNACADIHLSADGRFLYASNRGHNSIALFSVSEEGHLSLLDTEPVRGDWPRNFTLSPDGNFLLVANERSDTISVFKVDRETGQLTFTGNQVELSRPVCLKF